MNFGENNGHNPEDVENNPSEIKDNSEEEKDIENPELAGYRVELPKSATFNDLIDYVRLEFGDEAAEKVGLEIRYITQQTENFDKNSSIVEFGEKEGYSIEFIEYLLPIIFI